MLKKYGNINLVFTDTDLLLYEVETQDIYMDMIGEKNNYNFNDFPLSHHCFKGVSFNQIKEIQLANKKAIGIFKDELKGFPLQQVDATHSKCYSLQYLTQKPDALELSKEEKQIAKGVNMAVKKALLRHHMYKDAVFTLTTYMVE